MKEKKITLNEVDYSLLPSWINHVNYDCVINGVKCCIEVDIDNLDIFIDCGFEEDTYCDVDFCRSYKTEIIVFTDDDETSTDQESADILKLTLEEWLELKKEFEKTALEHIRAAIIDDYFNDPIKREDIMETCIEQIPTKEDYESWFYEM